MKCAAFLSLTVLLITGLLTACGAGDTTTPPPQTVTEISTLGADGINPRIPMPEVETDWEGILGTTVLRPGTQRVAFLLTGARALVTVPEVEVSTFFVNDNGSLDGPHETHTAGFNLWPYGTRGSYVTDLSFDKTGTWRLEIAGEEEGAPRNAILDVEVTDGFNVVDVGQNAPPSMNLHRCRRRAPGRAFLRPRTRPCALRLQHRRRALTRPTYNDRIRHPLLLHNRHLRPPGRDRQPDPQQIRRPRQLHPRGGLREPPRGPGRPWTAHEPPPSWTNGASPASPTGPTSRGCS